MYGTSSDAEEGSDASMIYKFNKRKNVALRNLGIKAIFVDMVI
jgi:hypothetical protein